MAVRSLASRENSRAERRRKLVFDEMLLEREKIICGNREESFKIIENDVSRIGDIKMSIMRRNE